ncbi:winged helix-turn-helix domain-containing tetratricopeptide repeat protein [Rhizobium sp. P44RR-XXIV]|uniref:winged helix-turn-helix domain-containing tetratricopeptide repeat protein n=1 Tax=Rhizobium sp. P44RR-XXIV TaxID=1921145 RepID=UPI0009CC9864|nr:winged helix-turn-helix domain-containing tetratricopeptide repeat protein [Rhizobium sp. P44RR-XXIV]
MLRRRSAFGEFLLNPENGTLTRNGQRVPLGRRGALLLEILLRRQGEIVAKEELIDAAWAGRAVEESNLSVQIALLRKTIGLDAEGREWIDTIPRVGYCFRAQPKETAERSVRRERLSIAVLPFANLCPEEEDDFFADGLADEIITTLSKVPGLVVIARTSSFIYRRRSVDIRRIAEELGVRFVLEGSVRRSGGQVRITAQLCDGMTGGQLWSEKYDRDLSDIFSLQDDIARRIGTELLAVLNPVEAAEWPAFSPAGTASADAYQAYLRGRAMQRGATQNADIFRRTVECFRQAMTHDPAYAAPYAALAMALSHNHYNRWTEDSDRSLDEAAKLVAEAIARDPNDPLAHGVAALIAKYQTNYEMWETEVETALSLNPNFAPALSLRGTLRMYSGNPGAAIRDLERAIRLDPHFSQTYLHHLGVAHIIIGNYETAVSLLKERIALVPETDMSRACLASALGSLGRTDEARETWRGLLAIHPRYTYADGIGRMPFRNPDDLAKVASGLRQAGICVSDLPH